MLDQDETECQRILTHPLHTISTGPAPLPIEEWPPLQDPEDKPSNMMRVPREELKGNMPHDLIIVWHQTPPAGGHAFDWWNAFWKILFDKTFF